MFEGEDHSNIVTSSMQNTSSSASASRPSGCSSSPTKLQVKERVLPPALIRSTSKVGLDSISGASSLPSSGCALSTVWFTLRVIITFSPPIVLARVTSAPSGFTSQPGSLGSALEFWASVAISSFRKAATSMSPLEAMVLLGTLQVSWLEAREVGGSLARQDRLLEGARELLSTRLAPLIMLDTVAMLTSLKEG